MPKFDKEIDLEPTEYWHDDDQPAHLGLLAGVVEFIVTIVLFWLFFEPIKHYVQEAVRPSVRAFLLAVGWG
jgi:hypothetical protein